MKLFCVTVKAATFTGPIREYVDWYNSETIQQAESDAREDMHRYGIPQLAQFEIVEFDPETLKPIPVAVPVKTLDSPKDPGQL